MQRLIMRSHTRTCLVSAAGCMRVNGVQHCTQRTISSAATTLFAGSNRAPSSRVNASISSSRGVRWFSAYPAHTVVPMPSLSPTMEVGSIANWMLKEGDKFEAGTAICEVETDKATVTYDATEEGYLAKILVGTGELKVGVPMMITVDDPADVAAFANYVYSDSSVPPAAPVAAPTPAPTPVPAAAPVAAAVAVAAPVPSSSATSGSRVVASPLARKLLRDAGLPAATLSGVKGTGPGGRVVSADVLAFIAAGVPAAVAPVTHAAPVAAAAPAAVAQSTQVSGSSVYRDFDLSDLAMSVAARQTAAKQQVPHYYLSVELNLSKLLALREELNGAKGTLSVMDFIIKASALAVNQVPDVNAAWMDKFVRRYEQVDINLVMGTGQGLLTPVIRDVGSRGLKSISAEVEGLEDSLFTEGGKEIEASKMAVGTFSIHNLGMYGVKSASPIVLAPQACALALGAIIDTVVPKGADDWHVAPVMVATLSCDHRVVDGAVGAQWLSALKTLLENPNSMLL